MLRIWFETLIADDGTERKFVHIRADKVFGYAKHVKALVPAGCWLSIPPELQPAMTKWLVKKCAFKQIGTVELDGVVYDVLEKE